MIKLLIKNSMNPLPSRVEQETLGHTMRTTSMIVLLSFQLEYNYQCSVSFTVTTIFNVQHDQHVTGLYRA